MINGFPVCNDIINLFTVKYYTINVQVQLPVVLFIRCAVQLVNSTTDNMETGFGHGIGPFVIGPNV
jgi:hypothetical protein